MPSLPELREVHAETLEALKLFDALCTEYGARYSLHGGTLLGAMREHGFIPWDDDADVTFTREEYEKFRDGARRGPLPEHLKFSEFSAQHPRVWLRRPGRPGAWIDLFIYDNISENRVARKLKLLGCAFFLAFTKTPESMAVSRKAGVQKGAKAALMHLGYAMGRPFPVRLKARMMNAWCKHAFPGRRSLIHRSNDQYSAMQMILPAEAMREYIRVPFEGVMLMVTKGWHEVLVSSYGEDYMTPKRVASHDNPAHAGFIGTKSA